MTMKHRIVLTVLLLVSFAILSAVWNTVAPVYEARAALEQMENSDESYTFGRMIASWNPVGIAGVVVFILMLLMWLPVWKSVGRLKPLSKETK